MVQANERQELVGRMPDGGPVAIPVVEYDGGPGPTVFVGCSIHGDEVTGQASLWRLRQDLETADVKGKLTVVPVMNPIGFNFNVRGVPMSTVDLNRLYPGDPRGSLTQRLTALIWSLAERCEYVIDVHTAGWAIPHILVDPVSGELRQRVDDLAQASGITVLDEYEEERYRLENLSSSLAAVALQSDRVALTLELGGFKGIDWSSVNAGYLCLRNILIKVGLLNGRIERVTSAPVIRERGYRRRSLFSQKAGILRFEEVPGTRVKKGDLVAEVRDVFGHTIEEVLAPTDGYIIAQNARSIVPSGGYVAEMAVRTEG